MRTHRDTKVLCVWLCVCVCQDMCRMSVKKAEVQDVIKFVADNYR